MQLAHRAIRHAAVDADGALRGPLGQPAANGQRRAHRGVRSEAIHPGSLHRAVHVEHRCRRYVHHVAGFQSDVARQVAIAVHAGDIDLEALRGADAPRDHHHIRTLGGAATGQRQDVGEVVVGAVQRVLPGFGHVAQYLHALAARLDQRHADMWIAHVAVAQQLAGDVFGRLGERAAGERHFAQQRQAQRTTLRQASLGGEVRVVGDDDTHRVAWPEHRLDAGVAGRRSGRWCGGCGGTRCGRRRGRRGTRRRRLRCVGHAGHGACEQRTDALQEVFAPGAGSV